MRSWAAGARVLIAVLVISSAACVRRPVAREASGAGLSWKFSGTQERVLPGNRVVDDTVEGTEQSAGEDYRVAYNHVPQSFATNKLSILFGFRAGYYALRRRGADSVTVVDTTSKEYFRVDFAALVRSHSPAFSSELEGADTVFAERVQPDSVIDGHRTEHWRLTDVHTMTVTGPRGSRSSVHSVIDDFVARDLVGSTEESPDGLLPTQPILAGDRYGNALHAAEREIPHGLRLLVLRRDEIDARNGRQATIARVTRLSDVQRVEFPVDEFEVPSGYQKIDVPPAK